MTGSLGKRYARALLALAEPEGKLDAVSDEITRVATALDEPRLRAVLLSPAVDAGARLRIVRSVVGTFGVSPWVTNLVCLLAERGRLIVLPDVARWCQSLVDERAGRTRVQIRSAAPLSPSERAELTELARRLTSHREVLVTTAVDPELLGGVVLNAGGIVYDGSLRTQLVRLSHEMAGRGV